MGVLFKQTQLLSIFSVFNTVPFNELTKWTQRKSQNKKQKPGLIKNAKELTSVENRGLHKSCPEFRNPNSATGLRDALNSHPRSSISYQKAALVIQEFQSAAKKAFGHTVSARFANLDSRVCRHSTHRDVGRGPPTTWGCPGTILKLHYLPLIKPTEARMRRVRLHRPTLLRLHFSVYSVWAWDFTQIPIPAAREPTKKHWQLIVSLRFGQ